MKEFIASLLPLCTRGENPEALLTAVCEAQRKAAADNDSASKVAMVIAGDCSGCFSHAVAGALMTFGEKHGPVRKARESLRMYDRESAEAAARAGKIVYGWGNSFFKDRVDPAWAPVADLMLSRHVEAAGRILEITTGLHAAGKRIYPNAAGLTAAACEIFGLPEGIEDAFLIMPRIQVWWLAYLKTLEES